MPGHGSLKVSIYVLLSRFQAPNQSRFKSSFCISEDDPAVLHSNQIYTVYIQTINLAHWEFDIHIMQFQSLLRLGNIFATFLEWKVHVAMGNSTIEIQWRGNISKLIHPIFFFKPVRDVFFWKQKSHASVQINYFWTQAVSQSCFFFHSLSQYHV